MSAVELAMKKVKALSDSQARSLLGWLAKQEARPRSAKKTAPVRRKPRRRQTIKELKAWHDSIRGTTDWEPPRMPDDLVHRVVL
jgi:hypothetical protein